VPTREYAIRFRGTLAGFAKATAELHQLLDQQALADAARFNVQLAFEEIGVNIVRHGRPTADVELRVAFAPQEVVLTFEDDGIPFDPIQRADPVLPSSLDEAQVGGLGVMLTKQLASRMHYERTAEAHNRLTLAIDAR
jgi:anti-sigma regulatory factor (Ser/Thr protein kinase)